MINPYILFFWVTMGSLSAYLAHKRGKNPLLWFFIGLLLGILGVFFIFFLPLKKRGTQRQDCSSDKGATIAIAPALPSSYLQKLWYYLAPDREQHGPMSFEALKRAFQEGRINSRTYVWNEEMEGWKPFGDLFTRRASSTS